MTTGKPTSYNAVSPYLVVRDARAEIAFLQAAFGAVEVDRTTLPDGRFMHAALRIDDSIVMLGERPDGVGITEAFVHLYLPDVDATYARALACGGVSMGAPTTHLYGDRGAGVRDPAGHTWWISTHVEDVPRDVVVQRLTER
jgi:uncharacterized glyoxalase superfamily protein PhnB